MKRQTIRIPEDLSAVIEERADENDVSESAAVRQLLHNSLEYEDLERKNERLR